MKIIRKILLTAIILQFCAVAHAKTGDNAGFITKKEPSKSCFFAELGGVGGLYSINIEHQIQKNTLFRLGYSYFDVSGHHHDDRSYFKIQWDILPVTVSYLFNNNSSHKFELGGGLSLGKVQLQGFENQTINKGFVLSPTIITGYRFQPKYSNISLRAGVSSNINIKPWPYMSIGYRF